MKEHEKEGGRRSNMTTYQLLNEYLYCRCPQCLAPNYLVLAQAKPRKYSKCQGCGEIIPTDSYRVMISSNEPLPVPRTGTKVI